MKKFWGFLVSSFSNQSPEEKLLRREKEVAIFERIFVKTPESDTLTCFNYRDPVIREGVRMIKYRYNPWLIQIFARVLDEVLLEELGDLSLFMDFKKPILVPIPMHWKKKMERKFNQAELLARSLAKESSLNFQVETKILKRTYSIPSQTKVIKEDRRKNVRGSFKVRKRKMKTIEDRDIILIDDVYTTGSTMREAELVLKKAGARSVCKVALAS